MMWADRRKKVDYPQPPHPGIIHLLPPVRPHHQPPLPRQLHPHRATILLPPPPRSPDSHPHHTLDLEKLPPRTMPRLLSPLVAAVPQELPTRDTPQAGIPVVILGTAGRVGHRVPMEGRAVPRPPDPPHSGYA